MGQRRPAIYAAAMALVLAACGPPQPPRPAAPSSESPSTQSAQLAAYYKSVQQSLLAQGLLRTDGGSADLPLSPSILARNFLRIAFYEEYGQGGAQTASPIALTRWTQPLRVKVYFGPSIAPERAAADLMRIKSYLNRLAQLTGLTVMIVQSNANFTIAMTNADERAALGPMIATALPKITPSQISSVTNLDRSIYCLVWTQSDSAKHSYERAFVFIPTEHPDLMRLACIHEEIAQALGLPNDVGTARPSIFNDDEEFALLTRQDEMMLRMLYHPALQNGMTEAQARPIVEALAREMLGAGS